MHKLLILLFFFTTYVFGQGNIPVTNQATSSEQEKEETKLEKKSKAYSSSVKGTSAEQEVFHNNVSQMYSTFNAVSWSSVRKTPTAQQQKELKAHLNNIEKINNESFEFHLFKYKVGNYNFSRIEDLRKAAMMKPNDITVLKELSAYSYIVNNEKELRNYLNRLNAMRVFSEDLELLAINILHSLPQNSILITHGANDTYPLLIQQKIKNVRSDVEIISLDHLQSKQYRKRLKKVGFKMPRNNIIDTSFFDEFMRLNKTKNIVVAPSVPRFYLEKLEQINTVGLGYAFFENDYAKFNKAVYEKDLKEQISNHVEERKNSNPILSNYLPYLFEIRNQYVKEMNTNSIKEIEQLILNIAKLSNKQAQVKALLNK